MWRQNCPNCGMSTVPTADTEYRSMSGCVCMMQREISLSMWAFCIMIPQARLCFSTARLGARSIPWRPLGTYSSQTTQLYHSQRKQPGICSRVQPKVETIATLRIAFALKHCQVAHCWTVISCCTDLSARQGYFRKKMTCLCQL
ncbi:hypothetical protein ABBQ38_000838 [Trebouxia sp. C0009 RCD-2024]